MARANLITTIADRNGYGKTALYEYKGYEYIIHYCNNGCMDDMNVGREHKHQQEMIDTKIANIGKTEVIKPGTFDADAIWNMYGWD